LSLPALDVLAAQVETMPTEEIPVFLERLAEVRGVALARMKIPATPKNEMFTVAEAAALLRTSEWYVSALLSKGLLGHSLLPASKGDKGRIVRIMGSDLAALLERTRIEAKSA